MKIALLFLLNLLFLVVHSQDTIFLKEGQKICGKIIEIDQENIKYKTCSNIDGPTYIKGKLEIIKIKFQNGEIEEYGKQATNLDNTEYDLEKFYSYTKKGKKVFVECDVKNGNVHANKYLKEWDYWEIVETAKEADFILEIVLIKSWPDYFGFAQFLDPKSREILLKTKNVNTEMNLDMNSKRGVIEKVIRKRIKPLYEK